MQFLTALGLAVPAGLNAYIPLLAVGIAHDAGLMKLSAPFDLLGSWWALALMGVLLIVEMIADKVPGADHVNDVIHSVVRPAAGGVLAVAPAKGTGVDPALLVLLGILVAGGVHAVKATSRPVVNTATGGLGAPVASAIEDGAALVTSVLAVVAPILVAVALAAIVAFFVWLYRRKRGKRAAASAA